MHRNTWNYLVARKVKKILGNGFQVKMLLEQQSEQGAYLCLGIIKEGEITGIIVNLSNGAEKWLGQEQGIKPAAECLVTLYRQKYSHLHGIPLESNHFSQWKDRIVYILERVEGAEERLSAVPHEEIMGMIMVFGIVEKTENPEYFKRITNEDMQEWEITLQELSALARKNTPIIWPPYICGCDGDAQTGMEILYEVSVNEFIKDDSEKKFPMYLMTNSNHTNGAGCIFYEDVLKNIAMKWQENIVILPISVHEAGLIPVSKLDRTLDEWKSVVEKANQDEAGLEEDILSSNVYMYDLEDQAIKIVASGTNQAKHFTS